MKLLIDKIRNGHTVTMYMQKALIISILAILGLSFTKGDSSIDFQSNVTNLAIETSTYLTIEEKQMLQEINLVRTQPKIYLEFIKELMTETVKDSVRLSGIVSESIKKRVVYEDYGEVVFIDTTYNNYYVSRISAIKELISELIEAKPLRALSPDESMYLCAKTHGETQATNNYIDHFGTDGTWPSDRLRRDVTWVTDGNENIASGIGNPREMVIQLLVDSGVEKRGHRKNILNPKWSHFTCYNVSSLNKGDYKWWIQEFAY